jgi:hypothetical protein
MPKLLFFNFYKHPNLLVVWSVFLQACCLSKSVRHLRRRVLAKLLLYHSHDLRGNACQTLQRLTAGIIYRCTKYRPYTDRKKELKKQSVHGRIIKKKTGFPS